jgi:hypothetical protein
LLNKRKKQQQQKDSKNRFLTSEAKDKTKISDGDKNNYHTPSQYAKVKVQNGNINCTVPTNTGPPF